MKEKKQNKLECVNISETRIIPEPKVDCQVEVQKKCSSDEITHILKKQNKYNVPENEIDSPKDDLKDFLIRVYQGNSMNREILLQIEKHMAFMVNNKMHKLSYTYPPLSSFYRMLVHRVADYFMLGHEVDSTGKQVVVYTTPKSSLPISLAQLCNSINTQTKESIKPSPVVLLRKPSKSTKDQHQTASSTPDMYSLANKSFEERRDNYIKARARIFDVPVGDCESMMIGDFKTMPSRESPVTSVTTVSTSEMASVSLDCCPSLSQKKASFMQCIHDAAKRNSTHSTSENHLNNGEIHSSSVVSSTSETRWTFLPHHHQSSMFSPTQLPFTTTTIQQPFASSTHTLENYTYYTSPSTASSNSSAYPSNHLPPLNYFDVMLNPHLPYYSYPPPSS